MCGTLHCFEGYLGHLRAPHSCLKQCFRQFHPLSMSTSPRLPHAHIPISLFQCAPHRPPKQCRIHAALTWFPVEPERGCQLPSSSPSLASHLIMTLMWLPVTPPLATSSRARPFVPSPPDRCEPVLFPCLVPILLPLPPGRPACCCRAPTTPPLASS